MDLKKPSGVTRVYIGCKKAIFIKFSSMMSSERAHPTLKTVCITGPECTGKSDLSAFLASHYKTAWVAEYARAYLNKLNRPYEQHDLIKIAHGQTRLQQEWKIDAHRVLICDTDLLTIKIWSEFKYGTCDKEILHSLAQTKVDLYLLCFIDLPWENDPQREHPDKRQHFWQIYRNEVQKTGVPFTEISGAREERRKISIEAIDSLLKTPS
jgi:NadR type nicotinamide-nucleotide adenylyltransferase